MQRSLWILVSVLVLVGGVFVGQGLGLLRGSSFMVGDPFWAFAGAAMIVVGGAIALIGVRRRRP